MQMPDFSVTDEVISKISKQYDASIETVKAMKDYYDGFAKNMEQQYLAHVIRTMEERLRDVSGNPMFQIVCSPVDESSKQLGLAGAQYFRNRCFVIYYHPRTEVKQLRVQLAHELGHLFLIEFVNSIFNKEYDEKTNIEPLATILGILAIFDKNDFYYNRIKSVKHKSPQDILDDFSLLKNRSKDRLNLS